jgi:hypothetical protein
MLYTLWPASETQNFTSVLLYLSFFKTLKIDETMGFEIFTVVKICITYFYPED